MQDGQEIQTGRVYHDEHFNHGVRLSALDDILAPSRKATGAGGLTLRATTTNLDANTAKTPVSLGMPVRVHQEVRATTVYRRPYCLQRRSATRRTAISYVNSLKDL